MEDATKRIWLGLYLPQEVPAMGQERSIPETVGQITENIRRDSRYQMEMAVP